MIEALARKRPHELASAWQIAWRTGARWREKLAAGRERPPALARDTLIHTIERTHGPEGR
jgi:hypothetical protein